MEHGFGFARENYGEIHCRQRKTAVAAFCLPGASMTTRCLSSRMRNEQACLAQLDPRDRGARAERHNWIGNSALFFKKAMKFIEAPTKTPVLQRLRRAGLRASVARIGVMLSLEAARPARLCSEEVFQLMVKRGTSASMSTVYRAVQDLETGGLLLREWREPRKAVYSIMDEGIETKALRLVCRTCFREVDFADALFLDRLENFAHEHGMSLGLRPLTIEADCASCLLRERV